MSVSAIPTRSPAAPVALKVGYDRGTYKTKPGTSCARARWQRNVKKMNVLGWPRSRRSQIHP